MEQSNEVRIGRLLSGESGSDERAAFENELASNPALKDEYQAYRKIWENSITENKDQWQSEDAWNKFSKAIHPVRVEVAYKRLNVKWAVAAAIILALGSFFLYWNDGTPVTYAYSDKNAEPLVLSDGSKIYLNKRSSVEVFPFRHKKRRVALNGEAFFEIAPDVKRPFTVESGGTITEVVGTSFNITQTPENIRIYVQKGKVIFKSIEKEKETVALAAGEAAVFRGDRMQLIPNPSPNINAWHTKHLDFPKNMSIAEIIEDASAYFNQAISLENTSLKDCRIGNALAYNDPDINAVLKPLASFVNGTIKMEDKKCSILGGNCP